MPDGSKHILRVHRPGYQSKMAINSELQWLRALKNDTGLNLIEPLAGTNNELVQQIVGATGETRYAVRFAFEKGSEAEGGDFDHLFADLGRFAAICHKHTEKWSPPDGFTRPVWNAAAILDADGLWGNWRTAPHVKGEVKNTLNLLDKKLRAVLGEYGTGKDRFGLVHADMRLANVLVHNGNTRLIDFDDCGFSWFAYDFAAAISFFEDSGDVPELKERWLNAYRRVRDFSQKDEDMLDATILLRRMALLAWIGSHKETKLAASHADNFAVVSAQLAEKFLRN